MRLRVPHGTSRDVVARRPFRVLCRSHMDSYHIALRKSKVRYPVGEQNRPLPQAGVATAQPGGGRDTEFLDDVSPAVTPDPARGPVSEEAKFRSERGVGTTSTQDIIENSTVSAPPGRAIPPRPGVGVGGRFFIRLHTATAQSARADTMGGAISAGRPIDGQTSQTL